MIKIKWKAKKAPKTRELHPDSFVVTDTRYILARMQATLK